MLPAQSSMLKNSYYISSMDLIAGLVLLKATRHAIKQEGSKATK